MQYVAIVCAVLASARIVFRPKVEFEVLQQSARIRPLQVLLRVVPKFNDCRCKESIQTNSAEVISDSVRSVQQMPQSFLSHLLVSSSKQINRTKNNKNRRIVDE